MLVATNLLHQPFARCSYHRKGDNTTFKDHLVRHKDASAEYVGTATGTSYSERLAILVPLVDSGPKSISLDFPCLSSCHRRKLKQALVFTLENQNDGGKIVARKIVHVQISKNFKRDLEIAEKGQPQKRPAADVASEPPEKSTAKLPRMEPAQSSTSSEKPGPVAVELKMNLPRVAAQEFLLHSTQFFKAKLYEANEQEKGDLLPCLGEIHNLLEKLCLDLSANNTKKN